MHYTEIDNLVAVILAAQDGDDEAMSKLLDMFSQDFDREAAFGRSYVDPDLRQELQIKFVFSVQRFNVAEHLSRPSTQSGSQLTRT
ncbi:helix-turn-helix domain-containing protein [Lacticaseibacillus daqingensis]|uniref:helix-turn-helix domain-containing protein n=1 Tax=Lacticaseibacillus daqingensis TaxID=2486014 RepID=UPI000F7986A4|nr:helix-turn-helix domain-containing protein [Lacticaseibacillus daqingensis]